MPQPVAAAIIRTEVRCNRLLRGYRLHAQRARLFVNCQILFEQLDRTAARRRLTVRRAVPTAGDTTPVRSPALSSKLFPQHRMKTWHETLAGVAAIVALVAVAVWYADESEGQPWFNTKLAATGTTQAALPQVCVNFVDWSADGKKLLTLSRGETSALGVLTLHDATGNVCRMPIDVSGDHVHCAALAPDGRHVLAGTAGGQMWWIDLDSDERIQLVKLPESKAFTRLAIATSGRVVAAATNLGSIFVCHPPDQDAVLLASDRQSSVADVRFSWDDKQLLSARNDGSIAVWNLISNSLRQELARHDREATAAA